MDWAQISQYKNPQTNDYYWKYSDVKSYNGYFYKLWFDDFIIAGGYKIEYKKYYKNSSKYKNVKIINTGKNTMTGGRILKLKKYLKNEKFFFMTYGDGVEIDIKLFNFHKKIKLLSNCKTTC